MIFQICMIVIIIIITIFIFIKPKYHESFTNKQNNEIYEVRSDIKTLKLQVDDSISCNAANNSQKLIAKHLDTESISCNEAKIKKLKSKSILVDNLFVKSLNIDNVQSPYFPVGAITTFSGGGEDIPNGWVICDGSNGTPDLRDKFVKCKGVNDRLNDKGGNRNIQLKENNLPKHNHTGQTNKDGRHIHHQQLGSLNDRNYSGGYCCNGEIPVADAGNPRRQRYWLDPNGSEHEHKFTTEHTGDGKPFENTPPFVALYYIKKIK